MSDSSFWSNPSFKCTHLTCLSCLTHFTHLNLSAILTFTILPILTILFALLILLKSSYLSYSPHPSYSYPQISSCNSAPSPEKSETALQFCQTARLSDHPHDGDLFTDRFRQSFTGRTPRKIATRY